MDGWFFIFERTSPFRILRVMGFIGGRRGSSKLEALSWTVLRGCLGVQGS
jgi:hypothetical protein